MAVNLRKAISVVVPDALASSELKALRETKQVEKNTKALMKAVVSDEDTRNEVAGRLDRTARYVAGEATLSDYAGLALNRPIKSLGKLVGHDQNISSLESLIDFHSEKTADIAKQLVEATNSPSKLEKIVLYIAEQGEDGAALAKKLVQDYLKLHSADTKKVDIARRCVMLAAKFGDKATYETYQKGLIWTEGKPHTSASGKNILHYACQSENAELVQEIATKFTNQYDVDNPFAVKDAERGFNAKKLDYYVNYVRPQHYISHSLAAKLDHLYKLDGTAKGSFTSMASYYAKIRKSVDQTVIGFIANKAEKDHHAAKGSIYSAKYVGGIGVTAFDGPVTLKYGMVAANVMACVFIGTAAIVNSAAIFYTKSKIRKHRSNELGYSPDLIFNKQEQAKFTFKKNATLAKIAKKYTEQPKHDLKIALTYSDFGKVKDLMPQIQADISFKTTTKLLDRVAKIHYFPDERLKKDFFETLASKAGPKELDKLIHDLMSRSEEDKKIAKDILNGLVNKETLDKKIVNRIALLAAQIGDVELFKAIEKKIPLESGLLSITGDKGSNLMHYACSNGGNAEMIQYLEPKLTKEFNQLSKDVKKDKLLGIKLRTAKNIFDISNNENDKPKHTLSRATANKLDRLNGINPETGNGFSKFINDERLGKNNEHHGMIRGAAGGMMLAFAMVCTVVPPAIELGWKLAHAVHAGPVGLLVAAAVETLATLTVAEITERVILPIATGDMGKDDGKSSVSTYYNKLSNEYRNFIYGESSSVEVFSKAVADGAIAKGAAVSEALTKALKEIKNENDITKVILSTFGVSAKEAIAPAIESMVKAALSQKPFAGREIKEQVALLAEGFKEFSKLPKVGKAATVEGEVSSPSEKLAQYRLASTISNLENTTSINPPSPSPVQNLRGGGKKVGPFV